MLNWVSLVIQVEEKQQLGGPVVNSYLSPWFEAHYPCTGWRVWLQRSDSQAASLLAEREPHRVFARPGGRTRSKEQTLWWAAQGVKHGGTRLPQYWPPSAPGWPPRSYTAAAFPQHSSPQGFLISHQKGVRWMWHKSRHLNKSFSMSSVGVKSGCNVANSFFLSFSSQLSHFPWFNLSHWGVLYNNDHGNEF